MLLALPVSFYFFGFLLIQLGKLMARPIFHSQQLIKLGVNGLRVAMFRALDEESHHPYRHSCQAVPPECLGTENQPSQGVDSDDHKGQRMS